MRLVHRGSVPLISTGDRMVNGSKMLRHIEEAEAREVHALTDLRIDDYAAYRERYGSLTAIKAVKLHLEQLLKGNDDE